MRKLIVIISAVFMIAGCKIISYSFGGTSIAADVYSISIGFFENRAQVVNPSLSNTITEALNDKYRKFTSLDIVQMDGDLELTGEITGYDVRPMAITADEVAAQNRLTVTVRIKFINNKYPEEDVEQSFSAYADYDSTQMLDSVADALLEDIIEKLIDEIFNATVAQW